MWQGTITSLEEIYNDLIGISMDLNDIHYKFIALTWCNKDGGGYIGPNEDILPDWALNESDRLEGQVRDLAGRLWNLPEVNKHDEKELYIKRLKEKIMIAEGNTSNNE